MTKLPATIKQPNSVEKRAVILVCLIVFLTILVLAIFSVVFAHHLIPVLPN